MTHLKELPMSVLKRLTPVAAIAALALAAACDGNSAGPEDVDPQALSGDLTGVSAAFDNNVAFQSLSTLSSLFPQYAATAALRGAMPMAVPPSAPKRAATLGSAFEARRQAAVSLALRSPTSPQALFPTDVLGKTLVWDEATDQYTVSATVTGAPANGIRIRLYAINPVLGVPVEPVQLLGYVDLTDEVTAQASTLGVLLKLGTTTIADYSISLTRATNSFSLSADGFIRNADGTGQVDFGLKNTIDLQAFTASIVYSLTGSDGTAIRIEVSGNDVSASVLFRVSHGGNSIELSGTVSSTATSETVDLDVKFNGTVVATITGDPDSPTIAGANGHTVTAQEFVALVTIFEKAGDFISNFGDAVFRPADIVFRP